jgi:8-oxo-dGTP pyrophosphatase MutT (NUDIX family)
MPDGTLVDHHVVRMPREAAGTIIVREGRVLLMYRHRFITDTWGWEIPAGAVDEHESLEAGAIREAVEESGWRPLTLTPLCRFFPANGVLGQTFHIFVSRDAVEVGEPDVNEATRIEWFAPDEVRSLLQQGEITDGLSFGAVTYALATGAL